ncbi:diguanylate cyclase [Marinomonas transparens]|uniref:diguanylate cyclase n=1 Tax=Marinomonas transparens TaxID=2795388 RepID=A0A934N252_9GAMM|nr:diguanylate cyclase [Marinomonas transparens]MBJ7537428.1 diguanylate cyclase [Marinomonas transparens]
MHSKSRTWLKPLDRIGFRLNLVLFAVLGFYLLTSSYSIYTLWQQAKEFKVLSHVQFERAMYAAELSRNTELLTAKTLEKIISQQYSNVDPQHLSESFKQFFNTIRNKLLANSEQEKQRLQDIDRLSTQYFHSLEFLDDQIFEAKKLNREINEIKKELIDFQENNTFKENISESNIILYKLLIDTANTTVLALYSESPGQLNRLMTSTQSNINEMSAVNNKNKNQDLLFEKIKSLSELTLVTKNKKIKQRLSILGAARQTRLSAQRLSSACFEFYLSVKNATNEASNKHSKLINSVVVKIFIFSLAFLALTILSFWFIQHYLIRRLNVLSKVMIQHINGNPVKIPQSGKDEISVIAKAFSIFVDSTTKAKSESLKAQKEAEEANEKLLELNESLQLISQTDDLTKIANRRHFFNRLRDDWEAAKTSQHHLSIIMIDLDYFKAYNDFYGHQEGDKCLYQVSQILKSHIDTTAGMIARYGGEEFIVLLPEFNQQETYKLANSLKASILEKAIPHEKSSLGLVTLSIGIATQIPNSNNNPEQLISIADQALYDAKHNGRNTVCGIQTT